MGILACSPDQLSSGRLYLRPQTRAVVYSPSPTEAAKLPSLFVRRGQYDALVEHFAGGTRLYSDTEFPPIAASIGRIPSLDQHPSWRRISEIEPGSRLIVDGILPSDILQGSASESYILSALTAVA
jgi:hypothetical protein